MGYLVLSRQVNESIIIGEDIEVRVMSIRGDKVRLGFMAKKDVSIHRKEIQYLIESEKRKSDFSGGPSLPKTP